MKTDSEDTLPKGTRICPRCGTSFRCGIASGEESCWCFAIPHVMPMEELVENGERYSGCLCPDCLHEFVAKKTKAND